LQLLFLQNGNCTQKVVADKNLVTMNHLVISSKLLTRTAAVPKQAFFKRNYTPGEDWVGNREKVLKIPFRNAKFD
jgi:hypothetical protein